MSDKENWNSNKRRPLREVDADEMMVYLRTGKMPPLRSDRTVVTGDSELPKPKSRYTPNNNLKLKSLSFKLLFNLKDTLQTF